MFDSGSNLSLMSKQVVNGCFLDIDKNKKSYAKIIDLKDVETLETVHAEIAIKLSTSEIINVSSSFGIVPELVSCDVLIGHNIISAAEIALEGEKALYRKPSRSLPHLKEDLVTPQNKYGCSHEN